MSSLSFALGKKAQRLPKRRRPAFPMIALAVLFSLLALLPPGFVIAVGVDTGWETIRALVFRPRVAELLSNTLWLIALTVPLCIALGVGLAWLTERTLLAGRRLWSVLAVAPLAIPAFVQSYAWVSAVPAMHGLSAGVFLSLLAYYPFIYMPVAAVLRRLDPTLEDVAASLGTPPWRIFFRVVLPQLRLAICGGALLVALHLLAEFGLFAMVRSVPQSIKLGLTASIGLFVAVLGFRNAGLVLANAKTNALMLGDFLSPGALVALCGLFLAIALQARKIPGSILWAILFATLVGIPMGVTRLPGSFIDMPHSLTPVLGQIDMLGALNIAFLPFLFVFFASEFFSTMGTTLAVGGEAGLLDEEGNMPHINRPFMVDSIAAAVGPWLGIPAATALIESSAAAEAGGKTGLTALSAAMMFLLMLLFTPVALMIPKEATAPALILIGLNMFSGLRKVDLANFTDGLPVLMMVMITLIANSFGTGIAGGLLFYVVIKTIAGKWREIPIGLWILAIPLVYYFATLVKH